MALIDRRLVLAVLAVFSLAACNKGGGGGVASDDMTLGNPNAKVTVIESASVAFPICAQVNTTVNPDFKKKYVDTGKVRYVAREALTGNPSLAVAGFLLARCAGKDKYFQVTDAVYRAQGQIYTPGTEDIRPGGGHDVLLQIAQSVGMSEDQFNKCISDEKAIKALSDRVERQSKEYNVNATPTFVVNGKPMTPGGVSLADLDAAIQPLLK
jgi:protein-disulfide isomerase